MINLKYIKDQKFNEIKLVEILFYTFPLWFIVGNLTVSLNTLLFIVASLFVIQRKQLTFRFNNSCWLLVAFFLYFFISTAIQFLSPGLLNEETQHWSLENNPILKSFLLTRFLILIFVIDTLFFNKILNLKKLFLSCLLCTSFVSLSIVLQYIVGLNLFGIKSVGAWTAGHGLGLAGPFGDEFIAGSYLQKFSFFSFFYIFETLKNKKFGNLLLIFIITIHLLATLLSGNRMPLILFFFGCLLIILLVKNMRFAMFLSLLIFLSISVALVKNDSFYLKNSYAGFIDQINIIKHAKTINKTSTKQDAKNELDKIADPISKKIQFLRLSGHGRVFQTAITMWKQQPFFGFGFKSFRVKCWYILNEDRIEKKIAKKDPYQDMACANHAHNYYLEILSEAGIIGISLMIIFFLILLKDSFNYLKKYYQQKNSEMNLLIPVIILFFLEIWPIKSTGSFFTTWGATFFWLNVAILMKTKTRK